MRRGSSFPSVLVASIAFLVACEASSGPRRPVTLLVTNATCAADACQPFDVQGWIPKFNVPAQPIGGFLALGRVDGATACLTFPLSYTLTVSGPADTTRMTWTPADSVTLNALGVPFSPLGSSPEFVPGDAAGWRVTFPAAGGPAELTAATACTQ